MRRYTLNPRAPRFVPRKRDTAVSGCDTPRAPRAVFVDRYDFQECRPTSECAYCAARRGVTGQA